MSIIETASHPLEIGQRILIFKSEKIDHCDVVKISFDNDESINSFSAIVKLNNGKKTPIYLDHLTEKWKFYAN